MGGEREGGKEEKEGGERRREGGEGGVEGGRKVCISLLACSLHTKYSNIRLAFCIFW